MEIVGVVEDVKHELNLPVTPEYYLPHAQDPWNAMVLVAKTSVDPGSLAGALRQQVWAIDKDQPVFDVTTMQEVRSMSVARVFVFVRDVGDLRGCRTVACLDRNLRRDGVRRHTTHAGNRNSHGARRTRASTF